MLKTNNSFKCILAATSLFALSNSVTQATEGDGLSWNGNLDFYYQASPQGHLPSTKTGPRVVEGRYFDRHSNELTLNMAELSFKNKIGKSTLRIDLAAGELVDQLSGGSASATNPTNSAANESTRNITQAILTYQVTDRLSFNAGKFYTNIGLELTRAKENWQYSRSYLFNYGPFWHEGGYITYAIIPGKLNSTIYVLNAWDGRISQEANKATTLAGNLNYIPFENLTFNYNYIGGDESSSSGRRDLHEVNGLYKITDNISAAFDLQYGTQQDVASVGTAKWGGAAFYLKAKVNDVYSISPRYEYFNDSDGFTIVGGLSSPSTVKQKISAITLTNSFDIGSGVELRAEARRDSSNVDQFFITSKGGATKHQETYTLAALYSL
jgi:hypothetical protein